MGNNLRSNCNSVPAWCLNCFWSNYLSETETPCKYIIVSGLLNPDHNLFQLVMLSLMFVPD